MTTTLDKSRHCFRFVLRSSLLLQCVDSLAGTLLPTAVGRCGVLGGRMHTQVGLPMNVNYMSVSYQAALTRHRTMDCV